MTLGKLKNKYIAINVLLAQQQILTQTLYIIPKGLRYDLFSLSNQGNEVSYDYEYDQEVKPLMALICVIQAV